MNEKNMLNVNELRIKERKGKKKRRKEAKSQE